MARRWPDDTHQYQEGKGEFMQQLVREADIWAEKGGASGQ
ncbi:hypothetical protein M3223_21675 [Paenibacillus pasadenensis]|nr:hypothetical protein [Paenibacillus pasadenensis]